MSQPYRGEKILSPSVTYERTGNKSRTTYWRWVKAGLFPKPVKLGPNSNGWLESEIDEWVRTRKTAGENSEGKEVGDG